MSHPGFDLSRLDTSGPITMRLYTGDVPPPSDTPAVEIAFGAVAADPDNYKAIVGGHLVVVENGETVYSGPIAEYDCTGGSL